MQEESRKYVTKYVEDMHSLITHGLKPVSQQVGEARSKQHAGAAQLITEMQGTLQTHERQLGQRLGALGTSPTTGVQDAVAAVAGVVAGIYNQVRTEAVSKSVRDDYTFISLCSVSWMMLMTTARSLGDHETEELAEAGYRDCARLMMHIDRVMPTLLFEELQQDHLPAQDVASWTQKIVSDAWTREAVTA
ncbi:MAG: hypothetical protein NVSMB2_28060 [Chloroflexota bacterium]